MVNRPPMKEQVQFITITTDPTTYTAEVMEDFGPAHGLDPANWLFLPTAPDQPDDATRPLAESSCHLFDQPGAGYQIHRIVPHVFDTPGQWRATFPSLHSQPTHTPKNRTEGQTLVST